MTLRIVSAVVLGLAASHGWAASGFYNMPTTLPQCFGAGWGPGYHAPMVLKPYYLAWNSGQGIERAKPRQYPPIYNTQQMYGSMTAPRPAPAVQHYPLPPIYAAPAGYAPTPARQPAMRPVKSNAEEVPAEPASPSDKLRPDDLPMPKP